MQATQFPPYLMALVLSLSGVAMASSAKAADEDAETYTIEEVQACSGDAMRLCHDAMPNVHKIELCMTEKKALLSQACQAMFVPGRKR